MGNLLDYLAWRGDLSLAQDPFNSIDALLLSSLSYVDFTNVVPAKGEGMVTMEEASKRFFELHTEEELAQDKSFINFAPSLLRALAESNRFKDAYLLNFVDDTDISREIQFAAVEIDLSDGTVFISYRGTDDRIVGWKEDFNLSYMTVPAETEADQYFREVMDGRTEKVRLGGHSKGGHLAIYAVASAPELYDKVLTIYSFDGPGFNDEAMVTDHFKRVQKKVEKFIPQTSIVGRLLTSTVEPVVVKSNELGIMQHNPLSWELEGKEFETLDFTDKLSDLFDETMTTWLDNMSFEERKVFVDELFSVFEASGCENISEMTRIGIKGTKAIITRMAQIKNDSGEKVRTLVKMFFINFNVLKDNVVKEKLEDGAKLITAGKNRK
ncbi:MAG: DUF2974 domain-containing protein [Clostridiales bacterium]|nr:DUF2974 domain-containing protein [Clostridiales bacterium]